MPHRAPYRFSKPKPACTQSPGGFGRLEMGVKGAISDVARFKVPEITFLGWENPKSVVLWSPPPRQHRQHFYPFGGAEYEKGSGNGVNRRFGPRHGRRRVAMIAGPLQPKTAAAPFIAATSAAV